MTKLYKIVISPSPMKIDRLHLFTINVNYFEASVFRGVWICVIRNNNYWKTLHSMKKFQDFNLNKWIQQSSITTPEKYFFLKDRNTIIEENIGLHIRLTSSPPRKFLKCTKSSKVHGWCKLPLCNKNYLKV